MKAIFTSILLFVSSALIAFGTDMTNGVFYIDSPVECHLISQNGASQTNHLVAGKSYMVGDFLVELEPESTNKTTFYLSGGPMIEAFPRSSFSINLFDQEVKNLDAHPRRAEFGSHNINITLSKGEFSIIYSNSSANSSLIVGTPYATYQLHGGKYFFRVTDRSVVVYVLDGIMTVHGDKNKIDTTDSGKLSVVVPFSDPGSGVDDKIVTSIKILRKEEADKFAAPLLLAEKKSGNVLFIVINGRVIGVLLK